MEESFIYDLLKRKSGGRPSELSEPSICNDILSDITARDLEHSLRRVKNAVIGNDQEKTVCAESGLCSFLGHFLGLNLSGDSHIQHGNDQSDSQRDEGNSKLCFVQARKQAILVIGSLIKGGPKFVRSWDDCKLIDKLFDLLLPGPREECPIQHCTLIWRAIRDYGRVVRLSPCAEDRDQSTLRRILFSQSKQQQLSDYFRSLEDYSEPQRITHAVYLAQLLYMIDGKSGWRERSIRSGLLNHLISALSTFVPTTFDKPSRLKYPSTVAGNSQLDHTRIAWLLCSINTIAAASKSKLKHVMTNRRLLAALAIMDMTVPDFNSPDDVSSTRNMPGPSGKRTLNAINQAHAAKTRKLGASSHKSDEKISAEAKARLTGRHPVILWLIQIIRTSHGFLFLMAAQLLVCLRRAKILDSIYDLDLSALLIPPMAQILEPSSLSDRSDFESMVVQEELPMVLTFAACKTPVLQKVAFQGGILDRLVAVFLSVDQQLTQISQGLYCLRGPAAHSLPPSSSLSPNTSGNTLDAITDLEVHLGRKRDALLYALIVMANAEDRFCKAILSTSIVQQIAKSLDTTINDKFEPCSLTMEYRRLILLECRFFRVLSRSFSFLRDNSIHGQISRPLCRLLRCKDIALKTAATGVICNLVLEFIPLREAVLAEDAMSEICRNTHSPHQELQLNSLWAAKHLIINSPTALKMDCLAKLNIAWLIQLIKDGCSSSPKTPLDTQPCINTASMNGDRAETAHAHNDLPMTNSDDITSGPKQGLGNAPSEENSNGHDQMALDNLDGSQSDGSDKSGGLQADHQIDATTIHPTLTISDCPVIREGLEIIRNMMTGNDAQQMIAHILQDVGQDAFLDILGSHLAYFCLNADNQCKVKKLNAWSEDNEGFDTAVDLATSVRKVDQSTMSEMLQFAWCEVIKSTLYVLVHMAACGVAYRQSIVSHPKLLEAILPWFDNGDDQIRVCCAWFVINVLWPENSHDSEANRARGARLEDLQFRQRLERMKEDPVLDCRERAKDALQSMAKALGTGS